MKKKIRQIKTAFEFLFVVVVKLLMIGVFFATFLPCAFYGIFDDSFLSDYLDACEEYIF
jgi:uncharacterized membrane protein YczE